MSQISKNRCLCLLLIVAFVCNPVAIRFAFCSDLDEIGSKRTIALGSFHPATDQTDKRLIDSAYKKLKRFKKFEIIPTKDVVKFASDLFEEGDSDVKTTLSQAGSLLDKGKELYDELRFNESIKTLSLSIRKFKEVFKYVEDASDLLRAQIYLGMAYVSTENPVKGKKYIMEMLMMDPNRKTRKLSEHQFPPTIRAIYQSRQSVINRMKTADVSVVCSPPSAKLYVDGFFVADVEGVYTIKNLPFGNHYVMVKKEGYKRYFETVSIDRKEFSINVNMEKWKPFSAVPIASITKQKIEYLSEAAKTLGVDVLVLGSFEKFSKNNFTVYGQLFDADSSIFSRIEEQSFGKKSDASKYYSKVVSRLMQDSVDQNFSVIPYSQEGYAAIKRPVEVKKEMFYEEDRKQGKSIFKKWWFWTIVGGAALATTGGVLMFTDVAKSDPKFNIIDVK